MQSTLATERNIVSSLCKTLQAQVTEQNTVEYDYDSLTQGLNVLCALFKANPSLAAVEVSPADGISQEQALELLQAMDSFTELTSLNLRNLMLSAEVVNSFVTLIQRNPKLKALTAAGKLVIHKTPERTANVDLLISACCNLEELEHVEFSDQNLESCGEKIAQLIKNNKVKILILRNCALNDTDAKIIGEALANNTSIKKLELNNNNFSVEAVKELVTNAIDRKQMISLSLDRILSTTELQEEELVKLLQTAQDSGVNTALKPSKLSVGHRLK